MSMDIHFRVLGIPRGCDESAMRKAYHQKALALHPDRNPGGAEQFKRVGEAYESLRAHFRLHGGRDPPPAPPLARPFPPQSFASTRQTGEEPPHLFTDAELFGAPPGGFARERRPKAPPRGPEGAPPPGTPLYARADARWRRAHGHRVPLSGYSSTRGGFVPPMRSAAPNPPNPPSEAPAQRFSARFTHRNGTGPPFAHHPTGGGDGGESTNTSPDEQTMGGRPRFGRSFAEREETEETGAHSVDDVMSDFEKEETRREIRRQWSRLEKDMNRKMEGLHGGRKNVGRGGAEEEDYVVRKRREEEEDYNTRRKERERLDDAHVKGILDEKLQLKKVLFTQLYTPDPADVALMSDSDVFVLSELMQDIGKRMQRVLEGRLAKGLCARCSMAGKDQNVKVFSCGHTSVCGSCAYKCAMCPICGAARR